MSLQMYEINLTKQYKFFPEHLCLPIVEIAKDFTLMDFFILMKDTSNKYQWLLDVLGYPTWFYDMYAEILDDPSESDNHAKNIHYLELSSSLDEDEHEGMGDVHVARSMLDIHGVGKDNGCGNTYGLSGCRMNDLKHLVIKLDPVLRNKLIQYPTLLQFMYSMLFELTFFGGPSDREDKIAEINESIEDVKEGKVETFPIPPTPPETQRRYGLTSIKHGLNFVECSTIDLDTAELFIKDDEKFKDIRKRLNKIIDDLKEMT